MMEEMGFVEILFYFGVFGFGGAGIVLLVWNFIDPPSDLGI